VQARRVLAANLDVTFGLRPAAWVLVAGLAVAAVAFAARLLTRQRPPRRSAATASGVAQFQSGS
jgi:methionine sulfoxide reductase heme-binding subunit